MTDNIKKTTVEIVLNGFYDKPERRYLESIDGKPPKEYFRDLILELAKEEAEAFKAKRIDSLKETADKIIADNKERLANIDQDVPTKPEFILTDESREEIRQAALQGEEHIKRSREQNAGKMVGIIGHGVANNSQNIAEDSRLPGEYSADEWGLLTGKQQGNAFKRQIEWREKVKKEELANINQPEPAEAPIPPAEKKLEYPLLTEAQIIKCKFHDIDPDKHLCYIVVEGFSLLGRFCAVIEKGSLFFKTADLWNDNAPIFLFMDTDGYIHEQKFRQVTIDKYLLDGKIVEYSPDKFTGTKDSRDLDKSPDAT